MTNGSSEKHDYKIDICFCLDCTASMTPWFDQIREQILSIVSSIKGKIKEYFPSINIIFRTGLLGFRDFCDRQNQFEDFYFNEDETEFSEFIYKLEARVGGDIAEDVYGALNRVLEDKGTDNEKLWKWESKAKFLFLITDSPSHGEKFGKELEDLKSDGNRCLSQLIDSFPDSRNNSVKIESIIKK